MSRRSKIFNEKDFKAATSEIERMYMYMMQPEDFYLNDREFRRFELLKMVFTVMDDSTTKKEAAKKLMELQPADFTTIHVATRAIYQAETLFGRMLKTNRDYERARVTEKAWLLYDKAMKEGWGKTAAMALAQIIRANRLDQEDKGQDLFETLELPPVELTRNPKVLEIQEAEIVQDEQNS